MHPTGGGQDAERAAIVVDADAVGKRAPEPAETDARPLEDDAGFPGSWNKQVAPLESTESAVLEQAAATGQLESIEPLTQVATGDVGA